MSGRVLVVGSLNADLTVRTERFPEPGETLAGSELVVAPGGKSANQAVAAGLLGADVVLLGAVGMDEYGDLLLAAAREASVDVSAVRRREGTATGTAMIVVDASGENTIIISPGANATLRPEDVERDLFDGAAVLCLCLEIPLETVLAAARAGHDAGAQVVLNLSPYRAVPPELLDLTDVLLVNAHEAAQVLGWETLETGPAGREPAGQGFAGHEPAGPDWQSSAGQGFAGHEPAGPDWQAVLHGFRGLGIGRAVVTLGGDGAVVLDAEAGGRAGAGAQVRPIAPTRVDVVDTTGSGDAFTAATAQQLAAGAGLVDAAGFAARAGAAAATRPGAQSSYGALLSLPRPQK